LAWTEVGRRAADDRGPGLPGKGELLPTGKLGDVMRGRDSRAVVRARARTALGLDKWFYRDIDVHVHVPEGRDAEGRPSAGSRWRSRCQRADRHPDPARRRDDRRDHAARNGAADRRPQREVGRGAARGIVTLLVPARNEKDLPEIPEDVRRVLKFVPVDTMDEVLEHALERVPGREPAAPDDEPERNAPATRTERSGEQGSGMAALKTRLFTPGPVEIPARILQALGQVPPHHRTEDFRRR
jgi:ATP-dependent Lon protease